MVHLAQIKNDSEVKPSNRDKRGSIVPGMEHISLEAPGPDDFSSSVYGSRFASEDLPSHELPEKEMPKEIAYRMIKDELSLDGNPMLKFVHFHLCYYCYMAMLIGSIAWPALLLRIWHAFGGSCTKFEILS
jgi:glutamate decarboxylase